MVLSCVCRGEKRFGFGVRVGPVGSGETTSLAHSHRQVVGAFDPGLDGRGDCCRPAVGTWRLSQHGKLQNALCEMFCIDMQRVKGRPKGLLVVDDT